MFEDSESAASEREDAGLRTAAAGGVLGALAMGSCCILPLVLFSLGATGAWIGRLGALYQYKWYFFAFAAASLTYGFWKAYGPREACEVDACARPVDRRGLKVALWTASAAVALSLAFPLFSPFLIGY